MFLDIHVLQTVPSSNINRDETGAPKTAIYGGVTRARVSSQAWKHAMRLKFRDQIKELENQDTDWINSFRTRRGPIIISQKIQELDSNIDSNEADELGDKIFSLAELSVNKTKKDAHTTKTAFMISKMQLTNIAKFALENKDKILKKPNDTIKSTIKTTLNEHQSLDIGLFGRMVADANTLSVNAASQVAHAISTHAIVPEFDYFSAVDDVDAKDNNKGAMMLGNAQFNSATYYRYANVDINKLMHNLDKKEEALNGLRLFIKDFIKTMPTGKQNSYANKTDPQYVMITLRPDSPVNLVLAFEEPVTATAGYMKPSIERLENEYQKSQKLHDPIIENYIFTTVGSNLDTQTDTLTDLLNQTISKIKEVMNDENTND